MKCHRNRPGDSPARDENIFRYFSDKKSAGHPSRKLPHLRLVQRVRGRSVRKPPSGWRSRKPPAACWVGRPVSGWRSRTCRPTSVGRSSSRGIGELRKRNPQQESARGLESSGW